MKELQVEKEEQESLRKEFQVEKYDFQDKVQRFQSEKNDFVQLVRDFQAQKEAFEEEKSKYAIQEHRRDELSPITTKQEAISNTALDEERIKAEKLIEDLRKEIVSVKYDCSILREQARRVSKEAEDLSFQNEKLNRELGQKLEQSIKKACIRPFIVNFLDVNMEDVTRHHILATLASVLEFSEDDRKRTGLLYGRPSNSKK